MAGRESTIVEEDPSQGDSTVTIEAALLEPDSKGKVKLWLRNDIPSE